MRLGAALCCAVFLLPAACQEVPLPSSRPVPAAGVGLSTTIDYTRRETVPVDAVALSAQEIRATFAGSAIEGVNDDGLIYHGRYEADGTAFIAFRDYGVYRLNWRLQGDQICEDWGEGEYCAIIYRAGDWYLWGVEGDAALQNRPVAATSLPSWARL